MGVWGWTYETCRPAEETLGSTGVRNSAGSARDRFLSRVLPYDVDSGCRTGSSGDSQARSVIEITKKRAICSGCGR
jgi:hypothetical protein